jgi:hypothetical protein
MSQAFFHLMMKPRGTYAPFTDCCVPISEVHAEIKRRFDGK